MEQTQNPNILVHKIDRYQCATLSLENITGDLEQFDKMLGETMAHLINVKARGVWLNIDKARCHLVSAAAKHGFKFHHAKKDYVLMQTWLSKNEINKLPHYPVHFVGIGGVVINDETDEILLIQEKTSLVADMWKIPGGLVDDGEYLSQAAEREVFEETGIKAKFQSLLCFRERADFKWKATDVYFVAFLKPITTEINMDPREIKKATWMKIDDYLKLENMVEMQKRIAKIIKLRREKVVAKLKDSRSDLLYDLAGFCGDEFEMALGSKIMTKNMFYGPLLTKVLDS